MELVKRFGVARSITMLATTAATHIVAQSFIMKRSRLRWWMHFCLFWGCVTAVAITFPLVFGWIHFTSSSADQMTYVTWLFGFPVGSFRVATILSWALFHGLDFSAVLVLTGISLALWRRMRDEGALSLESLSADFLPLILLFAISVTGLALTASTLWLRGSQYQFLAILHAITVISALLYLPFGKFFHIFQRPAQLGVKLYYGQTGFPRGEHGLLSSANDAKALLKAVQIQDPILFPNIRDSMARSRGRHWSPMQNCAISCGEGRIRERRVS